jgi:hypothetical protein
VSKAKGKEAVKNRRQSADGRRQGKRISNFRFEISNCFLPASRRLLTAS